MSTTDRAGDLSTSEVRRLSTLLEASRALSSTLDLKAALHNVLEILGQHHGAVRGMVALIDEDMPVVVITPRGSHFDKTASNLQQVKARGGRIVALVTAGDHSQDAMIDDRIEVPDAPDWLQPFVTTLPLQLLAYYVADLKGTDVDQPRNLAKSVTVE